MKKYQIFLLSFSFVLAAMRANAQSQFDSKPYLVSAIMDIAVDAQADIWLNGVYIAHCPHTTSSTGYQAIVARPDSLCDFKARNTLAIRLENHEGNFANPYIGVAYIFRFKLSDGTVYQINSASTQDQRCLYLPSLGESEPKGWYNRNFNDFLWPLARTSGDRIPGTAYFSVSHFGSVISFLTAGTDGYVVEHPGEKQLFRRYFNLDIGINPRCMPQGMLAATRNLWSHSISKPSLPVRVETPKWSITPVVLRPHQQVVVAPPQLARIRHPFVRHRVRRRQRKKMIATPTIDLPQVSLPDFILNSPSPTSVLYEVPQAIAVSSPTATPTMVIQNDGAIFFGESDANILVTFGDGPGVYKVEVVNENFVHLKTLLNKEIVADSEMWLTWDGKDDSGQDVPLGQYYILCAKEGIVLQKILLRRVP